MKKLLLLPLLLLSAIAGAQKTSGIITYERRLNLNQDQFKGSNLPEGFAEMISKENKILKVLYFTAEASLFENSTEKPKASEYSEGNMMLRSAGQPDEKVFTDIKNKKKTEQKDLMGRLFLIKDEAVPASKWKTTGRQKKILGMACMEAVLIENKADKNAQPVIAWYTTAIPVSSGPEGMGGLPGMILELSLNGTMVFSATRLDAIDSKMIKHIQAPAKGRQVTAKEFERISDEKIKEMQQQFGGSGNVIIRTEKR